MFSPKSTSPSSPQDDELLSAYLDGRLTPAEAARLEARLAADPELRRRLQELRRVVQLLTQAPRLAVPRAFVLSEAQVATVSSSRALGRMRWRSGFVRGLTLATAVVALALVFTLGVDVWSQRQTEVMVSMAPAAQPEALVAAPTAQPEALMAEATAATATEASPEAIVTFKAMTTTSEPATVEEPGEMSLMAEEATPTTAADRVAKAQVETPVPAVGGSRLRALEVILTAVLVVLMLAMVLMRRRRSAP